MLLNKKDIIAMNQEIGEKGNLRNESSLDFTIQYINKKPWLFELSYLLRALAVDHAFEDGNKRTALALVLYYFNEKAVEYDREKIVKVIYLMAKNNVTDINKIMRMVKDAILKN
jgi:prophage maintenance system killer protein